MGNRTSLSFESYCEFEANNCIPVTWLALFESQEFLIEENQDEGSVAAGYKTSQTKALQRLEQFINQLRVNPTIWQFFRPLEILRDELSLCPQETVVILDLTQFWAINEVYQNRSQQAVNLFEDLINRFTREKDEDLILLNQLVNQLYYPLTEEPGLATGNEKRT